MSAHPKGVDFITAEQAEAYDPFTIIYEVPRSQMPHIYMDSGTEDGFSAGGARNGAVIDAKQCAV